MYQCRRCGKKAAWKRSMHCWRCDHADARVSGTPPSSVIPLEEDDFLLTATALAASAVLSGDPSPDPEPFKGGGGGYGGGGASSSWDNDSSGAADNPSDSSD
jgi:hypothetical protein